MGTTRLQSRELSITGHDLNWKLVTIDAKSMSTIGNLFIKTGNHTDTISWSINATTTGHDLVSYRNQLKLATINAKSKGTILNLFIKTGNDNSLAVNSTEFLYQLMYLKFMCYIQVKFNRHSYNSYVVIYITWFRQSRYIFTAQLKFNVSIYKICKDRYNIVKLSSRMFTA